MKCEVCVRIYHQSSKVQDPLSKMYWALTWVSETSAVSKLSHFFSSAKVNWGSSGFLYWVPDLNNASGYIVTKTTI